MATFKNGAKLQKVQMAMLDQDVQDKFTGYDTSLAQNTTQLTNITVQPEKYGAVGDGVADDTVPIQNMIADALANGYNMQLNKKYYIASPITIDGTSGTRKSVNFVVNGYVKPNTSGFIFQNIEGGNIKINILNGGNSSSYGVKFLSCRALTVSVKGKLYGGILYKVGGNNTAGTQCDLMNVTEIHSRNCYQAMEHGDYAADINTAPKSYMFGQYGVILDLDSTNGLVFQNADDITINQLENHFVDAAHSKYSVNFIDNNSVHISNLAIGGCANALLYINKCNITIDKVFVGNEDSTRSYANTTNGIHIEGLSYVNFTKVVDYGCVQVLQILSNASANYVFPYIFTLIGQSYQQMVNVDSTNLNLGYYCCYFNKTTSSPESKNISGTYNFTTSPKTTNAPLMAMVDQTTTSNIIKFYRNNQKTMDFGEMYNAGGNYITMDIYNAGTWAGSPFRINPATADIYVGDAAKKLGFFGSNGGTKPTITGAKGSNTALASLISALVTLGLINDSTTT